jgi:hypothetical protein
MGLREPPFTKKYWLIQNNKPGFGAGWGLGGGLDDAAVLFDTGTAALAVEEIDW